MTASTRTTKVLVSRLPLLASLLAFYACSDSQSPTVLELNRSMAVVASGLSHVSGNGQTGTINTRLTSQIVVRAVDKSGAGISGVAVTFAAGSGSGSFSPASATTAADGTARTYWTLGATVGTQTGTVKTSQGNNSLSLSATGKAPVTVASVTVSPTAASVAVNGTTQLTAAAKDASGATISGTSFTWTSSNSGVATVSTSGLVTGKAAGSATVTASASGKTATATITVTTTTSSGTTGSVSFSTIMAGVRPRGFGAGTYSLKQPISGRRVYYVATTGNDANAGTSTSPLRTINRAAQLAVAGDVVTIANGTYYESVLVKNSGSSGAPIVFQAQNRGGVVLTGGSKVFQGANFIGIMGSTPQKYITVKGLIFRAYAGNSTNQVALRATYAWTIEDCLFDNAGETGVTVVDHNVRIERTTFQNNYVHALNVWGGYGGGTSTSDVNYKPVDGLRIVDVILKGNHTRNLSGSAVSSSRVIKIAVTRGLVIDNVESSYNYGSGMWLDNKNSNYTIRNSYFHHNIGPNAADGTKQKDAGRGLYIEKNWGTGLIENNVMADNDGAGIVVVSSNDVTFNNNLLLRNEQSIQFLAMTGSGYENFVLKNLSFRGTHMKGWRSISSVWARGGDFSAGPKAMGLSLEGSTYDNFGNAVQLVAWPAPLYGAKSLPEVQTKFGWEYIGKILSLAF